MLLTGMGFSPSSLVTVAYDSEVADRATTDVNGRFSITFTVPLFAAIGSNHDVQVTDEATQRIVSAKHRVPPPILTLEPKQGYPGTIVKISGSGFPPDQLLSRVFIGQLEVGLPRPSTSTDIAGSFIVLTSISGESPVSSRYLAVTATVGDQTARTVFRNLPPLLKLTPSEGPPGTTVTVHGIGFRVSFTVQPIKMGLVQIKPSGALVVTGGQVEGKQAGVFTVQIEVPDLPAGVVDVSAIVGTRTATAKFTVTP